MPYAERDKNGKIVALLHVPGATAPEKLSSSDPEVLEFLLDSGSTETSKAFLSSSDHDLVRVIEDLVELLIDKNIIMITELPRAAQQKLMSRKSARELFNKDTMLIVDKDDIL